MHRCVTEQLYNQSNSRLWIRRHSAELSSMVVERLRVENAARSTSILRFDQSCIALCTKATPSKVLSTVYTLQWKFSVQCRIMHRSSAWRAREDLMSNPFGDTLQCHCEVPQAYHHKLTTKSFSPGEVQLRTQVGGWRPPPLRAGGDLCFDGGEGGHMHEAALRLPRCVSYRDSIRMGVTKRRNGYQRISKQEVGQETTTGTHAR